MGYIAESMVSPLFIQRINNNGGIIRDFRPIFNAHLYQSMHKSARRPINKGLLSLV